MWKQAQYLQMKEHSVLSLQKYPFTRRSDEEKKIIKELGPDRPYFQFVCPPPPPPPQHFLAPAATAPNHHRARITSLGVHHPLNLEERDELQHHQTFKPVALRGGHQGKSNSVLTGLMYKQLLQAYHSNSE